jgi:imidazole glycerol-phosphate synthase subunit HisH
MYITIVDYGSGNISSVINSFKNVLGKIDIKSDIIITADPDKIIKSDKIILPGQGSFKSCIESLMRISGLRDSLEEFTIKQKKPLLGICVGMQMFSDTGYEEEKTSGFGWIPGKVIKIDNKSNSFKLPHIGWNNINFKSKAKLFKGIEKNSHMYFVHSYEFIPNEEKYISSTTNYSKNIVCAVEKENIFGTQFHPEKSEKNGLKIIENFINL